MKDIVTAALAVAKLYPVFPTAAKKPSWSNKELGVAKGQGGYKIATQISSEVKRLFSHPRAKEIAVPMGEMSGLICVDVDLHKDEAALQAWLDENSDYLVDALIHRTRSGGLHYIFQHPGDVGHLPATLRPGVDLKANGTGYICWPPTEGYEVVLEPADGMGAFPIELVQNALVAKGGTGRLSNSSFNDATDEDLIEEIEKAETLYPALRSLAYRMPGRRQPDGTYLKRDEMIRILENLMDTSVAAVSHHARHDDWADRKRKIPDLVDSAVAKETAGEITFSPAAVERIMEGDSLMREMIARPTRPIGPQRETTAEDIEARVAETDTDKPDTDSSSDYVKLSVGQLRGASIPPIKWVIPRMIPSQGMTSLAGMSNVGKTRWMASLVVGLAVGDTARIGLPRAPRKITALWIANEERVEDICRRLKAVALQHDDKTSADIIVRGKDSGMFRLVALNETGNLEIDEKNVALIVAEIRRSGALFVIFDPYVTLSDAADENSAASASMITKAFQLIMNMTGAAIMHAHHTPKERSKDHDWTRGDPGAWRGSGAIYSALDCGFTLSNWMPGAPDQRKNWKAQYLSADLSRFIVLDSGKMREGKSIAPVLMELVGQDMDKKEGEPIGVCRISNEVAASNALLAGAIDAVGTADLGEAMYSALGSGSHRNMTKCHRLMNGHQSWPDTSKTEGKQKLIEMFNQKVFTDSATVQVFQDANRKWRIEIERRDDD